MMQKVLMALGTGLAVSAAGAFEATLNRVEPSEFVIVAEGVGGGPTLQLRISDVRTEDGRTAVVLYQEAGVDKLVATIDVSSDSVEVSGFAAQVPFAWTLEASAGRVRTTSQHGAATFAADITGQPTDEDLDQFALFQDSVRNSPAQPVVQTLTGLIQQSETDMPESAAAFAILAARGSGGRIVPFGPIKDYVECLKEACMESGGCWTIGPFAGCAICPGTPWYQGLFVARGRCPTSGRPFQVAGSCFMPPPQDL